MVESKALPSMTRVLQSGLLALALVTAILVIRNCRPAVTDVCDLSRPGTNVTVCLLPTSDPRAAGPVIGTDCHWQTKTIDKSLRGFHGGGTFDFTFEVLNKCAQKVTVELELARGNSLTFEQCQGTDASGRVPLGDIVANSSSPMKRCTTASYEYKSGATRDSEYRLHAVKVNGSLINTVTYDPEVILEKAGEASAILGGPPRPNPRPGVP